MGAPEDLIYIEQNDLEQLGMPKDVAKEVVYNIRRIHMPNVR